MFVNWVRLLINDYRHSCSACGSFCCSVFTDTVRSPERLDDRQRVIIVNFVLPCTNGFTIGAGNNITVCPSYASSRTQ